MMMPETGPRPLTLEELLECPMRTFDRIESLLQLLADSVLDVRQEMRDVRQEIREGRSGQRHLIIATWTVGGGIIIALATMIMQGVGG